MVSAASAEVVVPSPSAGSALRRSRVGVAALSGLFLGTYFLLASPLNRVIPSAGALAWFVPAIVGIAFLVAGRLLGLVVESRTLVRTSVVATLLLAVCLCAVLRMKTALSGGGAAAVAARMQMRLPAALLDAASSARPIRSSAPTRPWLEIAFMVTIEESIKLLPIFFLIRRRTIRSAGDAMWAGALGGLCFGMIEAVNHALFLYARTGAPATTYLVRAFVMAPSHGIGAAIACGVVFASSRARLRLPEWPDMFAGFAVAVMMHAAHNALQAACGPSAQIATVFLPLLLLYGLSPAVAPALRAARPAR